MADQQYPTKKDAKTDEKEHKEAEYVSKPLKITELNQIISDFDSAIRSNHWLEMAQASWAEFKREHPTTHRMNKKKRFPLWYTTLKVRQPLVFSKLPDVVVNPLLEDVEGFNTMVANVGEKFSHAVLEMFPFFTVACSARDDLLMTQLGQGRVMFDCKFVDQPKREALELVEIDVQDPQTGEIFPQEVFVNSKGEQVPPEVVQYDYQQIPFIELEEMEEKVKQERVFMKPVCYKNYIWDWEAKDFSEWEYNGYRYKMNKRELVRRFGQEALTALNEDHKLDDQSKEHRRKIEIIELEHEPSRCRYIFEAGGKEIIKAIKEDAEGGKDEAYRLRTENFFSCPYPMLDNLTSENSIPVCEYAQVKDILDQIHDLYERKTQCSRLARPRALYDKAVTELSALINKSKQGSYIGVNGLSTKARQGQVLVLYLDVTPVINAMVEFGKQIQEELSGYDQVTAFSEVVRGVTNPYESATAVERQSQFTMSRLRPIQMDMQRWCRDSIRLLIDLALEKFSEERCYEIVNSSLSPEERQGFTQIIAKLKDDNWRSFSLDIETDSTIMIDEQVHKQQALELGQMIGQFLGQMAQAAASAPETLQLSAVVMEKIIDKYRGGKDFKLEIRKAFQAIMAAAQQKAAQAAKQPPPTPEQQRLAQKDQTDAMFKQRKQALDEFKAMQDSQNDKAKLQLDQLKVNIAAAMNNRELSMEEREMAIDEYIKKAQLEMDQVFKSLDIQERFLEEQRLSQQAQTPETVLLQPIIQESQPEAVILPSQTPFIPAGGGPFDGAF